MWRQIYCACGTDSLRIGRSPTWARPVWTAVVGVSSKAARVFEELGCSGEEVEMVLLEPYDSV